MTHYQISSGQGQRSASWGSPNFWPICSGTMTLKYWTARRATIPALTVQYTLPAQLTFQHIPARFNGFAAARTARHTSAKTGSSISVSAKIPQRPRRILTRTKLCFPPSIAAARAVKTSTKWPAACGQSTHPPAMWWNVPRSAASTPTNKKRSPACANRFQACKTKGRQPPRTATGAATPTSGEVTRKRYFTA